MFNFKLGSKAREIAGVIGLAALMLSASAEARSTQDQSYPAEAVWSAAVRFLRVDMRFPVLEKDKDAGYILFDFVQDTKVYRASLELLALEEANGRAGSRVIVSVSDLPRHVEATLLEKLARKLKEELGSPVPPPARPKTGDGARRKGDNEDRPEEAENPRRSKDERRRPEVEEDENAPVRGGDGLPRLRTRELPRAEAN